MLGYDCGCGWDRRGSKYGMDIGRLWGGGSCGGFCFSVIVGIYVIIAVLFIVLWGCRSWLKVIWHTLQFIKILFILYIHLSI